MSDHVSRPGTTLFSPIGSLSRVSWGAIIAGTLLVLIIQLMLGLLGLGIGLSTVDPTTNGTPSLQSLGTASGLWTLATVLIATFIGAYAAGRLAGSPTRLDGVLNGIVTWATATLLALYLITSGVGSVIGTATSMIGGSFSAVTNAVRAIAPNSLSALPDGLEGDVRQLLQRGQAQANQAVDQAQAQANQAADQARQATGDQDLSKAIPEVVRGLGENATPEQRQAAVQVISQQAGIPQAEAEQRLNQFQQRYNQVVAQAKQAADEAAKTLSTTAFAGFVALLLGLIVAAIGGAVGRPAYAEDY